MSKITDEDRENLTDEELEALESDDDIIETDDGEGTDDEDESGEDTNVDAADDEDDDESDDGEGDEDDDSDDETGDEDQPGRDDGADDEPEKAKAKDYTPELRATLPDDFDDQLKAIGDKKADLRSKYNEGEIDFDEYEQERDKLDEQRRQLEQAQFKAQISQDMRMDRWVNRDVANFLASHDEYQPDTPLFAMLDSEVRRLQAEADKDGKDQLDPAILDKAHENIRKSLTKALGGELPEKKQAGNKQKIPAKRDVPPTLQGLPAAETEDMDGGRWAHLDGLLERNPAKFEEALAKLSEEDRNAYLASQ